MDNSLTTKETTDFLKFIFDLGDAVLGALDDNKITTLDAPRFLTAALNAPTAIEGINKIPAELLDLSAEEATELKAIIVNRFDIPDDQAEILYENIMLNGIGMFRSIHRLYRHKKTPIA